MIIEQKTTLISVRIPFEYPPFKGDGIMQIIVSANNESEKACIEVEVMDLENIQYDDTPITSKQYRLLINFLEKETTGVNYNTRINELLQSQLTQEQALQIIKSQQITGHVI